MQEPIELGQALSDHLLIVGEPGAGKSTLLHWLAVTFAQGNQRELNRLGPSVDEDRLPILVELGRLPDRYLNPEGGEVPNWLQFLPEYLTAQIAFTNTPPQLLTQALTDGRCLLLFDGLDEVADRQARTRLARSLVELARLSPGNRVIIGSRPTGVSESKGVLHPQFQRCQIQRFTSEDVLRFFRFWYSLDRSLTPQQQQEAADTLYTRVQATPAILQLASTPLLSTILVLIWRNEGDLPERRVELYERCCRMLIERWEASHDVAYQGALSWPGLGRPLAPTDTLGLCYPQPGTAHDCDQGRTGPLARPGSTNRRIFQRTNCCQTRGKTLPGCLEPSLRLAAIHGRWQIWLSTPDLPGVSNSLLYCCPARSRLHRSGDGTSA